MVGKSGVTGEARARSGIGGVDAEDLAVGARVRPKRLFGGAGREARVGDHASVLRLGATGRDVLEVTADVLPTDGARCRRGGWPTRAARRSAGVVDLAGDEGLQLEGALRVADQHDGAAVVVVGEVVVPTRRTSLNASRVGGGDRGSGWWSSAVGHLSVHRGVDRQTCENRPLARWPTPVSGARITRSELPWFSLLTVG